MLAAYLDEVDDDPLVACKILSETGVSNVVLRSAWGTPLVQLSDNKHSVVKTILGDHGISVMAVALEHHTQKVGPTKLGHAVHLSMYYECKLIAPFNYVSEQPKLFESISVLAEIINDTSIVSPAIVAGFMSGDHHNIRLLYDPAMLMFRFNLDPFSKYWVLLKKYITAVDIHDFKHGRGFVPAGLGDARLKLVINENPEWMLLEPGLGRRYANLTSKKESFLMALNAFNILQRLDNAKP